MHKKISVFAEFLFYRKNNTFKSFYKSFIEERTLSNGAFYGADISENLSNKSFAETGVFRTFNPLSCNTRASYDFDSEEKAG